MFIEVQYTVITCQYKCRQLLDIRIWTREVNVSITLYGERHHNKISCVFNIYIFSSRGHWILIWNWKILLCTFRVLKPGIFRTIIELCSVISTNLAQIACKIKPVGIFQYHNIYLFIELWTVTSSFTTENVLILQLRQNNSFLDLTFKLSAGIIILIFVTISSSQKEYSPIIWKKRLIFLKQ